MLFLHNVHATGINSICIFISSSSFFFLPLNSSMRPPKLPHVSTEQPECCGAVQYFPPPLSLPQSSRALTLTHLECGWRLLAQTDVGPLMGNCWEPLSAWTKLPYPKGYRRHYLSPRASVSGRRHGWLVNFGAFERDFLFWALWMILRQHQAKKTCAVRHNFTWSFLGYLIDLKIFISVYNKAKVDKPWYWIFF